MSGKTGCVGIIFAAFIGGVVLLLFFTALGSMERAAAPLFPTPTAIVVQAQAQDDHHAIDAVVDVSKFALEQQKEVAFAGTAGIVMVNAADEGASALSSLAFIVIGIVAILILVKSFNGGGHGGGQ